jgi:hypothetical protein
MGKAVSTSMLVACILLAGCGGGGGGVNSAGSSGSSGGTGGSSGGKGGSTGGTTGGGGTTPATNQTLANLVASQSFTNDAVTSSVTVANSGSSPTLSGISAGAATVSVNFDVSTGSYTLSTAGRSQTFAPSNAYVLDNGLTNYRKTDSAIDEIFSRDDPSLSNVVKYQYVAAGYWQRNSGSASAQKIEFDAFTYGLPTPAAAVPRTGSATYATQLFGFLASAGKVPQTIGGPATLSLDFLASAFSLSGFMLEGPVGSAPVTSGPPFYAGGKLSASGGTLAGSVAYSSASAGIFTGSMAGRLYGPAGEELGAAFNASNNIGDTLVGTMTGQKSTGADYVNQSLINIVGSLYMAGAGAETQYYTGAAPNAPIFNVLGAWGDVTNVTTWKSDGSIVYARPGGTVATTFSAADKVVGRANFDTYRKDVEGQPATLEIYKVGSGNSQLALTYATIGTWSTARPVGTDIEHTHEFFAFGTTMAPYLIDQRTGTGHYSGVAYGEGINRATFDRYDVTGTSTFDIDFGGRKFTSSLTLSGKNAVSGATSDFGSYALAGTIVKLTSYSYLRGESPDGTASLHQVKLYGPIGEELAGSFSLGVPAGRPGAGTSVVGVVAARQQ